MKYYNLRALLVHPPITSWAEPKNRELFGKILHLKCKGYSGKYSPGTIPFDVSDFYSYHLILCLEGQGALEPVAGYKILPFTHCQIHNSEFPIISLIKNELNKSRKEFTTGHPAI